ncbi:M50 family metallopeptidase [Paenibacillus sp. GCM10027627]|uniref:M50 family metallopeptidase n=1 Tax=unclassified Paenibacillus TaxID=185978 RepID=UPI00363C7EED
MASWFRTGIMVAVVLILTRFLPFSAFFRNVNTLVHELAHAIAALVLQGKVMEIRLYADQSGVTLTSFQEGWMLIPIAFAGYAGASLFSVFLFWLHSKNWWKQGLVIVTAITVLSLLLFIRNGYGIAWGAGFAALTAIVAFLSPDWLKRGYFLLISFICLVESVVSAAVVLYLALVEPGSAGDAASLSQAALLPAFVWGLLFVLISFWCARLAIGQFFDVGRRQKEWLQNK